MIGRRILAAGLALGLANACVAIDRVSTSSGGRAANADTTAVLANASGRYAAFESAATNVVGDETNGQPHVYRKDRTTGTLVNVDRRGTARAASATLTSISADGNLVVFVTASALVPQDVNGVTDVYVRDVAAGHTTLATVLPDGSLLTADEPALRADFDGGHHLLWLASSGGPTSFAFLRDLDAGTTTLVDGPVIFDTVDLSADGNHVLATFNCGTPRVCRTYVYVKDLTAPYPHAPAMCDGSTAAGQSTDGRFVLVNRADPCGGIPGLYDRQTGTWTDVAFGATGGVTAVALDGAGRVALLTAPDTVMPGGTAGFIGLFSRRIATGESARVAVNTRGVAANASQRPADAYGISADGSTAVFTSAATNLVPDDAGGHVDAFARVLSRRETTSVG